MYTIEQVTQEEFEFLKANGLHILSDAKSRVDGAWSTQVQGMAVSLAYDSKASLLGFILERAGQRCYINGEVELHPAEEALIGSLKSGIEGKLSKLKQAFCWFNEA